jgi:hypothetical protein
MARAERILRNMRNNPRDWRIEDLKLLAGRYGIAWRQPGTSHVTFRSAAGAVLSVPAHKPIKPVYVKAFLKLIEQGGNANEDN